MNTETWDLRRTLGAVVVAAAIAGLGGTAIAAATDRGMHGMPGGMMHGGPPPPPAAHRTGGEQQPLHGENVVIDGHGGFRTLVTQTGRVLAISPTSITARSDDGYVGSYVIHEAYGAYGATPPFHVDDVVTIDATREGEAAVVTTVRPPL